MYQHVVKNPSKSRRVGTKIKVWRVPGQVRKRLGPAWAILDVFWKGLGPTWNRLRSILRASWAVLGGKRYAAWTQVGSQNGTQIYRKSIQKPISSLMPLGIVIFFIFFDFRNQKPSHVASNMHSKFVFVLTNPESPILLQNQCISL